MRSISPKLLIPISTTAASVDSVNRNSVLGIPISLFRFPSVLMVSNCSDKTACTISFVVVLPTLPVKPTIFTSAQCLRCRFAISKSAWRVLSTKTYGISASGTRSQTTAAAPFCTADAQKSCPSKRSPQMATYSAPSAAVRLSIVTAETVTSAPTKRPPVIFSISRNVICIYFLPFRISATISRSS